MSGVAANPLTVNQIRQQPSAKSDTRLLFYSADLQHVVRHGSHGIHSPIPIPISPQSLYLMPPSATQSHQSCHGSATERPQSHHGSHGIIPSHPHLPTVALPNATFGYSKSSEPPRSRHGVATEPPRSCHGAATEPPQSRHESHGIHSPIPIPISPQSLYLMPPSATQSHQSCHGAATEPPQCCHGAATDPPQCRHGAATVPPGSCHGAATERPWSGHGAATGIR